MKPGTIQRTILIFQDAFQKLKVHPSEYVIEDLAIVVDRALNTSARSFHTPEHVFKLSTLPHPIQSLAALYHDVVYYQVDQGFSPEISSTVSPFIKIEDDDVFLIAHNHPSDALFALTLDVFNLQLGQQITPANGLNEVLSALVAVKQLDGILSVEDLFKVVVCIEATIPFRKPNGQGEGYGEITERRLMAIGQKYSLAISAEEMIETVKLAVIFSNKDVESFAEENPDHFLDDTWKLLPESNVSLRENGLYSIRDYRKALGKTESFLCSLDQGIIFKRYQGVPTEEHYLTLVQRASENLHLARQYLGIQLLGLAILESLAELTGGDAPMALFAGGGYCTEIKPPQLGDFLPLEGRSVAVDPNSPIYRLLQNNPSRESTTILRNSSLPLFIYRSLGPDRTEALLDQAKEMFAGRLTPLDFMKQIDRSVAVSIASSCAALATTRREALNKVLEYL